MRLSPAKLSRVSNQHYHEDISSSGVSLALATFPYAKSDTTLFAVIYNMAQRNRDALCDLCQNFTAELVLLDYLCLDKYPSGDRWSDETKSGKAHRLGYGFRHKTAEELSVSSQSCDLCRLIMDGFTPEQRSRVSCFGLFPGRDTYPRAFKPRIVAASFEDDFPSHILHVSKIRPLKEAVSEDSPKDAVNEIEWGFDRAISDSSSSQEAFDTARFWVKDCIENHPECPSLAGVLPTRVIDVCPGLGVSASLLITKGEKERYVALTHCWGGNIPCKMTTNNIDEYQKRLPMHELPQNFLDAIRVTRELGLRYLWVDALCIIQDSAADWAAEAMRMAAVYSGAAVTVSALDSPGSTAGFLRPRGPSGGRAVVTVGPGVAAYAPPPDSDDGISGCVLNTRGWCLQERLLSPMLLHFGRGQMYWECRAATAQEDNANFVDIQSSFTPMRRAFGAGAAPPAVGDWYVAVEEFSRRRLTYGTDKLPAMAGVAGRFLEAGVGGAYVAGLWERDLESGIFWAPVDDPARTLTRPAEPRAPSWSWASVDGAVFFNRRLDLGHSELEILGCDISVGAGDPTAPKVEGRLTVRGFVAKMRYTPEPESSLFRRGGRLGSEDWVFTDMASMDFDLGVSRECCVLITGRKRPSILLLEEVDGGVYRRIGSGRFSLGPSQDDAAQVEMFDRFSKRNITIV